MRFAIFFEAVALTFSSWLISWGVLVSVEAPVLPKPVGCGLPCRSPFLVPRVLRSLLFTFVSSRARLGRLVTVLVGGFDGLQGPRTAANGDGGISVIEGSGPISSGAALPASDWVSVAGLDRPKELLDVGSDLIRLMLRLGWPSLPAACSNSAADRFCGRVSM